MDRQFLNVVDASWGQFAAVQFGRDHEHRRADCPDFQHWVVPQKSWRLDRPGGKTESSQCHLSLRPFERCHRIVLTDGVGYGLRIFRTTETENLKVGYSHVWRISHLGEQGKLDPLTLDCLLQDLPVARKSTPPNWLQEVWDLLHDDPSLNWTIQELSDFASISSSHLIHEFRAHYGERLFETRNRLRVEKFLSSRKNAQDLGFYDESHLSREVRKRVGVSPKDAVLYKTKPGYQRNN